MDDEKRKSIIHQALMNPGLRPRSYEKLHLLIEEVMKSGDYLKVLSGLTSTYWSS